MYSSLSHAHYKLNAQYRRKRRLGIQNRLSCTNTSRQQEVPTFCLRKQGISVLRTSLWSGHCPSGISSSGAHNGSLPPSSGDIGNPISRIMVNTSPRPSSFTMPPVSVTRYTGPGRPQAERSKIRTVSSLGYPVSGASITPGSR